MAKRSTTEEFINKAKEVHGETYDYSLVEYISSQKKIKIICKHHGVFEQTPSNHIHGYNKCPQCADIINGESQRRSLEDFVSEARKVHGNTYDYTLVEYRGSHVNIQIRCIQHGLFFQTPSNHLRKRGCPVCAQNTRSDKRRMSLEDFINKSNVVHNGKYDYSKVVYRNNIKNIEIICRYHGSFLQRPGHHLQGTGCPECSRYISNYKNLVVSKNCNEVGILYIIRMQHKNFRCLKIGITSQTVRKRYTGYTDFIISELSSYRFKISDLCYIEQTLLKKYKSYKVNPPVIFSGHTECLIDSEKLINNIKKDIENYEQLINTENLL